ncbi:GNAT family N-acetyltransferase [Leuconostoc gasicomitatum]|uniref:GNAT family N-acetyltransferase n=1 Tax=Leuconostoc gasicomitatum TaxID=115778 RepID=UPI0007E01888|nr:GNAT family N-acetyltransferase [Leuconostoc gasicomitatum]CUW05599.1 Acetyltransferase, GNAT family [Leuconostoc gasicomitatum]
MNFRHAVIPEIKQLSELAARAFNDYALYQKTIRQTFHHEAAYQQFIQRLHDVHLATNVHQQKVFVLEEGNKILSIVILEADTLPKTTTWQYLKNGGLKMLPYFFHHNLAQFLVMLDEAEKLPQQQSQANWHVNLLAVSLDNQGRHIGSRTLTDFVIPYIKSKGAQSLSLITNTQRNVTFYQKNNFKITDERILNFKGQQVKNWSLVQMLTD